MAQQRRVMPAVGVAAVGLGIGAGALGLYRGATAEPPRPVTTWTAPPTAAGLLAEGRELVRQNKLGEALAKADAAAKLGNTAAGGDTPDALRRDAVADGKKQIAELTAQAKVLSARGDTVRTQASLDLARQIAAEIGQPTAPPAAVAAVPPPLAAPTVATPSVVQAVVFHPADPVPLPLPVAPVLSPTPPTVAKPTDPLTLPALTLPTVAAPAATENPLLPAPPALSLNPSGPPVLPAVPEVGDPPPAPGATPVKLPKLAAAVAGLAVAVSPAPAQDASPKPGPGGDEVVRPMTGPVAAPPPAPAGVSKEQFDALKADLDGLKEYKRQVQDILQGKADGGKSVLDAGVLKRLSDLEEKLDRLDKTVEALRLNTARPDPGRTALSPAAPAPMPAAPTNKTAVRLVNDYPSDLTIFLNGASHRLKPSETKTVEVPSGSFTYELMADGAKPITRTIRDDETVTLRIK